MKSTPLVPIPFILDSNDGKHSLLTTDQGIRGILFIFNDLCYLQASDLSLEEWQIEDLSAASKKSKAPATEANVVSVGLLSLEKSLAAPFIREIAKGLSSYDWRTSSTPDLPDSERLRQAVFRGSSGYKELRKQLLEHLAAADGAVATAAKAVLKKIGY